jgi:hypothetical protein
MPLIGVAERFYRLLTEVAGEVEIRGPDAALQLAGRFGLRRFFERQIKGDTEMQESNWLDRAARLRKEARDLSAALEGAHIYHCFFKGIALIGRFYRIDDRRLDDIDLLVGEGDRNATLALLHAQGYSDLVEPGVWGPATDRPGVTMYQVDPQTGERDAAAPLLDLHWGLESVTTVLPGNAVAVPNAVLAKAQMEHRLPILPDEYHAALVLHHLVRHDLLHVRGLLDLALLWEALPRDGGRQLTDLAQRLGVSRALGIIGRVLVDDLHLYPLRGVRLGAADWRGRRMLRRIRMGDWVAWAARHVGEKPRHVTLTRSLSWRRFLLADAPRAGQLLGELLRPPPEYLRWRWPKASASTAWRRHLLAALRA